MAVVDETQIAAPDESHQWGGDGPTSDGNANNNGGGGNKPNPADDVPEHVRAYVKSWISRIKAAKRHYEPAFKQMDECMTIVSKGDRKAWTADDAKYVVPILNRIINVDVAKLYARNPTALAKRKQRMMYTVWDGTLGSLKEAMQAVQQAQQQMAQAGAQAGAADAAAGIPMQPPPPPPPAAQQAMAVIQDAQQVKQYDTLMDNVGKTLTLLHQHFLDDPAEQYKILFKALVRRVKTIGVGYVTLNFQRILEKQPDITAKIDETTERMATVQRLVEEMADDEIQDGDAQLEELRTTLEALQDKETVIVKEGPFLAFNGGKDYIIDPACKHLKTLLGAGWVAEERRDLTTDDIKEDYGVDVKGNFTQYKPDGKNWERWSDSEGKMVTAATALVWRVMSKKTGTEFVICEGYPGYLQPPSPPKIKLPRFYNLWPLVFNEVESETDLFPPSDVWLARHPQSEYNRSREFLRQHRTQNRPGYVSGAAAFETSDLEKLNTHESGEIMQLQGLGPTEKIGDKLQAKPVMAIDPKLYEVESIWSDVLRTTGSQQANLGPTSGATATESAIANESQEVDASDNKDDLDEFLSSVVEGMGRVMLAEMSPDIVKAIIGPGAQWPALPQTRQEIAESISLETRAGASGRPNASANLAKMERAMPFITQLPGINPVPLAEFYTDNLELPLDDMVVEGLPSIQTINALAQQPPPPPPAPPALTHDASTTIHNAAPKQPGGGTPPPASPGAPGGPGSLPAAQGPMGAHNAPQGPGTRPGGQPGFPAPNPRQVMHFDTQGNPINVA